MTGNDSPRRSILSLLRRGAKGSIPPDPRPVVDEAAVWMGLDRVVERTKAVSASADSLSAALGRLRSKSEAIADRWDRIGIVERDIERVLSRADDALERLSLTGITAGLDGSKIGESGRAFLLLSDTVRLHAGHVENELSLVRESLSLLTADLSQAVSLGHGLRDDLMQCVRDVATLSAASVEAQGSAGELDARLRRHLTSDPESAKLIADVMEQARALLGSLQSLSERMPRTALLSVLRPLLEPLARLLADDDDAD